MRPSKAISNACRTNGSSLLVLMAQPTTKRENRSRITARYSHPSLVHTYVVSLTHLRLGASA